MLRGGVTRRESRANRNFVDPIGRNSVQLTLRDRTALAIRRQAERDATTGKRFVKYAACNIPLHYLLALQWTTVHSESNTPRVGLITETPRWSASSLSAVQPVLSVRTGTTLPSILTAIGQRTKLLRSTSPTSPVANKALSALPGYP